MAAGFFFYDLETSGFNPRQARIMQFAGRRTDMDLNPIGEPFNLMIRMTPDTLPDPDAILVTGITPQATLTDGVTETEFLELFYDEVMADGTIFLGYNTVRFDDEFMRFLKYRNFYDPYEWQWANECSRWDLLDVVRMTRALRPDGIEWPFNEAGKATNKLELLTKLNGLSHEQAHDALNDVDATIAVARLIRGKQPELFNYLLDCRKKDKVREMVCKEGQPVVYACGRYPAETQKTSVVVRVASNPRDDGCLVYDLRHDPTEYFDMTPQQLADRWQWTDDKQAPTRLPVKEMKFNKCPAVAPLGVLDAASQERIGLDLATVQRHLKLLRAHKDWTDKLTQAFEIKDRRDREHWSSQPGESDDGVDGQLYDGFPSSGDKTVMRAVRTAKPADLTRFAGQLTDQRFQELLPLFKARNYPESLSDDERQAWQAFCRQRLFDGGQSSRLAKYFARLQELAATASGDQAYLLEELQLYGQSIMPAYDDE